MSSNLSKRILTSFLLLIILSAGLFINKYFWLILLLIVSIISFNEFNNLIKKAFKKKQDLILLFQITCVIYLVLFIYTSYDLYRLSPIYLVFFISICILSDTGGFFIGKLVGGKKLTKISPNKTVSGCIGSFIFSLLSLIILFLIYNYMEIRSLKYDNNITALFSLIIFLSFICQMGDLLISYFKRKAKVKDTGIILPGHGGLLDRIDGAIFVLPTIYILEKLLTLI